ncbi:hypothetical protein ACFQ36_02240 [Arthrobacter sp. GCM10027362]|uniref:hypothetical protein n=1 Tax=Arthrobacter sp. GCM10027362 TaxID=3273379 RepID=UPI00362ED85E
MRVEGSDPANSGQQPADSNGNRAPAGVRGDSRTGGGVPGTSGAPPQGSTGIPIETPAGVEGHGLAGPGMVERSFNGYGLPGVLFGPTEGNGATGFAGNATGVGINGSSNGVRAQGTSRDGAQSLTLAQGCGVYGLDLSTGGGVQDQSLPAGAAEGSAFGSVPDSAGVLGENPGENPQGFASQVLATARVTGTLIKGGGSFTADHPLDPEHEYLSHAFIEAPEMLNVSSGTVTTGDDGAARVELPDYFEALNSDFRYQLTVLGHFAQAIVAEEIEENAFTIRTDMPRVKVCWQVIGVRRDAWAAANRIPAEEDKADGERGRYLHPELYGKGREDGVHGGAGRGVLPERAAELVPEDLRERVGNRLQSLIQDGPVDDEELRQLLSGIGGRAEASAAAARARLKEQWGKVQESIHVNLPEQRLRPDEG